MTARQFRAKAERAFRRANPDAAGATIEWAWLSRPFDNKGGPGRSRVGTFVATAPGYQSRRMQVSAAADGSGMIVR